jgi:hypothetical protein
MTQILHCFNCVNYTEGLKCKAFPDGIPDEILSGDNIHDAPFEGDNGITFKIDRDNEFADYFLNLLGPKIILGYPNNR